MHDNIPLKKIIIKEKEYEVVNDIHEKYALIPIKYGDNDYYRLIATKDFADVKEGEQGGIVSSGECIPQDDRSWAYWNSVVINSKLLEDSSVEGHSTISNSTILCSGIGNRDRVDAAVISGCEIKDTEIEGTVSVINSNLKNCEIRNISKENKIITSCTLFNVIDESEELTLQKCVLERLVLIRKVELERLHIEGRSSALFCYPRPHVPKEINCLDISFKHLSVSTGDINNAVQQAIKEYNRINTGINKKANDILSKLT